MDDPEKKELSSNMVKTIIKVNVANGQSAFTVEDFAELGEVTGKFDCAGTNYRLEYETQIAPLAAAAAAAAKGENQ